MRLALTLAAVATATSLASAAVAHPKLVASNPTAGATVARPARVQLRFDEKLVSRFSRADIVMTAMPGMTDHPPMKVAGTATVAPDGRTLVVTPAKPLAAGSYRVDWRVVAADTHPVTGKLAFSVR